MKTRLIHRTAYAVSVFAEVSKWYKFHANGCGLHGYTTLDILESKIGTINLVNACKRAIASRSDTYSRKYRCGLRIDFYGK